jgi:hypothetical protein
MSIKAPSFRHFVHNFGNKVQITIPSRKNIFYFAWFAIWLIVWGFVTSRLFLLWELMIQGAVEMNGTGFIMAMIICLVPFLIALLGMGAFAVHKTLWHISGKEIIEVTHQDLTVTKQVLRWKWSKVYSFNKIRNLRANTQKLSMFLPSNRVRRFLGGAGMIAFNYGRRTPSFGLDISAEEAEDIIGALQDQMPQQNAG